MEAVLAPASRKGEEPENHRRGQPSALDLLIPDRPGGSVTIFGGPSLGAGQPSLPGGKLDPDIFMK